VLRYSVYVPDTLFRDARARVPVPIEIVARRNRTTFRYGNRNFFVSRGYRVYVIFFFFYSFTPVSYKSYTHTNISMFDVNVASTRAILLSVLLPSVVRTYNTRSEKFFHFTVNYFLKTYICMYIFFFFKKRRTRFSEKPVSSYFTS